MTLGPPEMKCLNMLTPPVAERTMFARRERSSSSIAGERKMSLIFLACTNCQGHGCSWSIQGDRSTTGTSLKKTNRCWFYMMIPAKRQRTFRNFLKVQAMRSRMTGMGMGRKGHPQDDVRLRIIQAECLVTGSVNKPKGSVCSRGQNTTGEAPSMGSLRAT